MVAVFTGVGAGFERGSGASLGARDLLLFGGAVQGRGGESVSVNAATGNLVLGKQDEFLLGRGPDIAVTRTYNSLGALDENGDQWRYSTDLRIFGLTGAPNAAGSVVKRVSADGAEINYVWKSGGYYEATDGAGAHDRLTFDSSANVWTWTDGDSRVSEKYGAYGSYWRLAERADTDGNRLTYSYSGDKLASVTTADGGKIDYVWSGANITSIVSTYRDLQTNQVKTLTRTRYVYDDVNRLKDVIVDLSPSDNLTGDGNTYWTTYTYHGTSKLVASITQKDGSSLSISYDGANRVSTLTQTVAAGDVRTTRFTYSTLPQRWTEVTDGRGFVTKLDYDAAGQLTKITAPPGESGPQSVSFAYDGAGNVSLVTDATGRQTSYVYDANGNVTRITDPNGNVVDRAYDANNSLVLETRTGSASAGAAVALYTRYVYDSENHLRYTISAEGHVTQYSYSAEGQLTLTRRFAGHAYAIGSAGIPLATLDGWAADATRVAASMTTETRYDQRGAVSDIIDQTVDNDGFKHVEAPPVWSLV